MNNPFESIDARLSNIESLLLDLKHKESPDSIVGDKNHESPISKKEVCLLLGCSEPTMTKWMAAGKIPFGRKGRRVYFFRSEVLKSLEQPSIGRREGKRWQA